MTDRKWYEANDPVYWYETHDNLTGLANWLHHECCYFSDPGAMLYYFEKPWKWEREWALYQLWEKQHPHFGDSKTIEFIERIIEAVDDPKMTAESLLAELEEEAKT